MSKLFNELSEKDVKLIDNFIQDKVGDHESVGHLLREWSAEKETLYKMFGNHFILNKKIEYNKPISNLTDELNDRFSNYDSACNQFRRTFDRFLWENRVQLGNDYDLLQGLMDVDRLIKTVYEGDTFYVNAPDGKPVKVQNGCKPMRLISKICKLYGVNPQLLSEFQNEVSVVLNQKKLTGNLTISIHPLDYMTMSENECDWSSCMNWSEPGCYCRGTVEMMNSPMVVVAYLNAENPMRVRGGEWSNKKWRELFIVTPEVITGVKGYPYQNEDLVQLVNSWLRDLAVANLGWQYDEKNFGYKHDKDLVYTDDNGVEHNGYLCFSTNTMYNDFGSINKHFAIFGKDLNSYRISICYSGREECMCCGTLDGYYDSEGTLVCEDCDNTTYCSCCGERIYNGDIYWLDDEPYCYSCYSDAVRTCDMTDEEHAEKNMMNLYLIDDTDLTKEEIQSKINDGGCKSIYIYRYVQDYSYTWRKYFTEYAKEVPDYYWGNYKYVTPAMCTDRGFEIFGADPNDYQN